MDSMIINQKSLAYKKRATFCKKKKKKKRWLVDETCFNTVVYGAMPMHNL